MIAIVSAIYKKKLQKSSSFFLLDNRNLYFSTNLFNVAPCLRNFVNPNKFIFFFSEYVKSLIKKELEKKKNGDT